MQQEFVFQDAIDALCQGVLVAVIAVSHRASDAMTTVQMLILVRTVLDASVRVMDQGLAGLTCFECHLQSLAERHSMLSLRDSPENIQLASRLVALYDQPEPEVVIEAEVVEISKTKQTDLGINYPSGVTLSALVPDGGSELTLRSLNHLSTGSIGVSIPDVAVNFNAQDSEANVLASPRLRVKSGEKGKIMVGDKVPIITTTTSGTSLAYQSVTYQDVGLKLNVEPTIYADDDIAISVELEVSSLGTEVTTSTGTTAYQINTRNASTLLRLRDGEQPLPVD